MTSNNPASIATNSVSTSGSNKNDKPTTNKDAIETRRKKGRKLSLLHHELSKPSGSEKNNGKPESHTALLKKEIQESKHNLEDDNHDQRIKELNEKNYLNRLSYLNGNDSFSKNRSMSEPVTVTTNIQNNLPQAKLISEQTVGNNYDQIDNQNNVPFSRSSYISNSSMNNNSNSYVSQSVFDGNASSANSYNPFYGSSPFGDGINPLSSSLDGRSGYINQPFSSSYTQSNHLSNSLGNNLQDDHIGSPLDGSGISIYNMHNNPMSIGKSNFNIPSRSSSSNSSSFWGGNDQIDKSPPSQVVSPKHSYLSSSFNSKNNFDMNNQNNFNEKFSSSLDRSIQRHNSLPHAYNPQNNAFDNQSNNNPRAGSAVIQQHISYNTSYNQMKNSFNQKTDLNNNSNFMSYPNQTQQYSNTRTVSSAPSPGGFKPSSFGDKAKRKTEPAGKWMNCSMKTQLLSDFCVIPKTLIRYLIRMSEHEEWGPSNIIIRNYLDFTFRRIIEEKKLIGFFPSTSDPNSSNNSGSITPYALCFNTGLLTAVGCDLIYAFITPNQHVHNYSGKNKKKWFLSMFVREIDMNPKASLSYKENMPADNGGKDISPSALSTDSSNSNIDQYSESHTIIESKIGCGPIALEMLPERANYFSSKDDTSAKEMVWNFHTMIETMSVEHIIQYLKQNESKHNFKNMNDGIEQIQKAISVAIKRAKYNARLAVPQYFIDKNAKKGELQLLLPLYLNDDLSSVQGISSIESTAIPKCAACFQVNEERHYELRTVLSLLDHQVYTNSRLVQKIDQTWLKNTLSFNNGNQPNPNSASNVSNQPSSNPQQNLSPTYSNY